jgi:hypothetical protein
VLNIKVTGLKVIQNRVEKAEKKIQDNISSNVLEAANFIEMRALGSVPVAKVNGGTLKRSYRRKEISPKPNLKIRIGFTAPYAPFQEFGSLKRFSLNSEYSEFADFALKFKVYGPTVNRMGNRPRRYFLHHYIIARRALSRKTSTIMKNLFK